MINKLDNSAALDKIYSEVKFEPFAAYRSIGASESERYGFGIIGKNRKKSDCRLRQSGSYTIVLVLRGEGVYRDGLGHEYPLKSGSVFQKFAEDERSEVQVAPNCNWLECFIELGHSMTEVLEQHGCICRFKPVFDIVISDDLIDRLLKIKAVFQEDTNKTSIESWLEIMNAVRDLLKNGILDERDIERNKLINAACVYLANNLEQPDHLYEFCRRHSVGYENFRKIFKQKTGISPHHYRIRCRLDAACTMLANPELTITEISRKLGYNSPYEFSAQFGHLVGVPPTAYRK